MDNQAISHQQESQFAVVIQPHAIGFEAPAPNLSFAGLNYLSTVSQLLVKQKIELIELTLGIEGNNHYDVFNQHNQLVFTVQEDTNCCTRQLCGPSRSLNLAIKDIYGYDAITIYRPYRCSSICCPCCLQELEIKVQPSYHVGTIKQNWSCYPSFDINNETGDTILKIKGPFCTFSCGGDVEFKVLTLGGDQIGSISKKWSGILQEMYTDADTFGIKFPLDLDVKVKAILLGACFLIDFMYFESPKNNK